MGRPFERGQETGGAQPDAERISSGRTESTALIVQETVSLLLRYRTNVS